MISRRKEGDCRRVGLNFNFSFKRPYWVMAEWCWYDHPKREMSAKSIRFRAAISPHILMKSSRWNVIEEQKLGETR